jgi:FtsZ-binding cell division protein ZapB
MTQSFWESGAEEGQQPEQEQHSGQPSLVQAAPPETVALSVDEFSALEERILRAVNLVKRERMARAEAEERAAQVEAQLRDQAPQVDRLQTEVNTLRQERDQVRQRVERLLSQLDALEL